MSKYLYTKLKLIHSSGSLFKKCFKLRSLCFDKQTRNEFGIALRAKWKKNIIKMINKFENNGGKM